MAAFLILLVPIQERSLALHKSIGEYGSWERGPLARSGLRRDFAELSRGAQARWRDARAPSVGALPRMSPENALERISTRS
jgi:hypothetical protein